METGCRTSPWHMLSITGERTSQTSEGGMLRVGAFSRLRHPVEETLIRGRTRFLVKPDSEALTWFACQIWPH